MEWGDGFGYGNGCASETLVRRLHRDPRREHAPAVTKNAASFVPAIGKVVDLQALDSFVWSTLHGWGALPLRGIARSTLRQLLPTDPGADGEDLAHDLKAEEEALALVNYTTAEAESDYPYLFSLVSVRLWAMIEAAGSELLVTALLNPEELPGREELVKLRGPLLEFSAANQQDRAEMLLDLLRGQHQARMPGVAKQEALLSRLGLGGPVAPPVREILLELAEVRHCIVHRDGIADQKLIDACPWLGLKRGDALPATMSRFWLYRTAVYWYVMELARRWATLKGIQPLVQVADEMSAIVLDELTPAWAAKKRVSP